MRKRLALILAFSSCFLTIGLAQEQSGTELRRILSKTIPAYPDLARRMNISGTVKVMAVVQPNGTVKAVEPVGGSPLLIRAAQDAVLKWKFAPAASESKEPIELKFNSE